MSQSIRQKVGQYYTARLQEHGSTHWGVDWNSTESQVLRFEQLMKLHMGDDRVFSINDYGCGYGAMINYLNSRGWSFSYAGYDIAPAMIEEARAAYPSQSFTTDAGALAAATYTVASGIFNVRMEFDDDTWLAYIHETLDHMWSISDEGMAFNCLTSYSDPPYMRDTLYYASPTALFDHCKRHYSRHVALLHDYGLYEFTMLVRREAQT